MNTRDLSKEQLPELAPSERSNGSAVAGIADDEMDWDAYAEQFDVMCELNPAYFENIRILLKYIREWDLPDNAKICDVGAGTGNYICAVYDEIPTARFTHVDFDRVMNKRALEKYQSRDIATLVDIYESRVQTLELPDESFDVVLCVNALYAMSPQSAVLKKIYRWLKPDGRFFIIDFGRRQNVVDWGWYLLKNTVKQHGVVRYAKACVSAFEIVRQNRRTERGQLSGRYWLHTTQVFGQTLDESGFLVDDLFTCYRGYADLAVCRKKLG